MSCCSRALVHWPSTSSRVAATCHFPLSECNGLSVPPCSRSTRSVCAHLGNEWAGLVNRAARSAVRGRQVMHTVRRNAAGPQASVKGVTGQQEGRRGREEEEEGDDEDEGEEDEEEEDEEDDVVVRMRVTRLIRQYGRDGNVSAAVEEFTKMQKSGVAPDPMVATALIDCCLRCGEMARAERTFFALFRSSPQPAAPSGSGQPTAPDSPPAPAPLVPDAVAVGVLLRAYGQRKPAEWGKIQQLLRYVEAEFGVPPSAAVFNELVNICTRDNDVARGIDMLDRMAAVGVAPDDFTFEAVKRKKALRSHYKKLFG